MFNLSDLPYDLSALEPQLPEQQMELHYKKHHQAYVDNLNKLVKDTKHEHQDLDTVIRTSESGPIFNNAAQIWNHDFYWKSMTPSAKSKFDNDSKIGQAILDQFDSLDAFKKEFKLKATKLFGSGWVYLVADREHEGQLLIIQQHDAETPFSKNKYTPLINCDVWEHSYLYTQKYFADRGAYVDAYIELINWEFAESNFIKATTGV